MKKMTCADCALGGCGKPGGDGKHPDFCEGTGLSHAEQQAMTDLYCDEDLELIRHANETAHRTGVDGLCRVEETMDLCRRMGYSRIGIACCGALQSEGRIFAKILRGHGYEVFGVCCKFGSLDNAAFAQEGDDVVSTGKSCNPIVQAKRLNEAGTQFNVVLGLCVGHDSLFFKHSDAPVTVLAAKDRALGNNPCAALTSCTSAPHMWSRLLREDKSLNAINE